MIAQGMELKMLELTRISSSQVSQDKRYRCGVGLGIFTPLDPCNPCQTTTTILVAAEIISSRLLKYHVHQQHPTMDIVQ
jgi:hypothetical protein